MEFDKNFYRTNYSDLSHMNDIQLLNHYRLFAQTQGRLTHPNQIVDITGEPMFDINYYKSVYSDLSGMNDMQILIHYRTIGKKENRKCFNINKPIERTIIKKRQSSSIPQHQQTIIKSKTKLNHNFNNKKPQINHYYNTNLDNKKYFRTICEENMNYIRNLYLPDFCETGIFESVLIEYRCLPHIEFLIRNTIIKLGEKWCHSIICGNLNYDFMKNMCATISSKIKIIKTNYDNLFPSEYSRFLSTLNFWDLLQGEKILIYQEDSIIFKTNIDDFIKWDYIGAPWLKVQNDTKGGVGNGGISLRTKSIMKDVINNRQIDNIELNKSTLLYMKNTKSVCAPEDVYFCKTMEDFSLGVIADRESASNFSTESILNQTSFAGHNFWLCDNKWPDRIFENNIIQFKPNYDMQFLEHRGGWKSILNNLIDNRFFNEESKYEFFDILETKFLWRTDYKCNNKWAGIIHLTPKIPNYLHENNDISYIFKNNNFIESLKTCICLITLSNYISNWLKNILQQLNLPIPPIYTLKHPVVSENIKLFNFEDYKKNQNKKIIQIGKQLRKVSSIYLINVPSNYKKIWLTGTKNIANCKSLLKKECEYFDFEINTSFVDMYYTKTFEEYDNLLKENIVFVDLFDAAANNTVLECIIRNTPILVNKLDSVIEYLGEGYPLYFTKLEEIPSLLTNETIFNAHIYLKELEKKEFSIDYFTKKLINIFYFNSNNSNK